MEVEGGGVLRGLSFCNRWRSSLFERIESMAAWLGVASVIVASTVFATISTLWSDPAALSVFGLGFLQAGLVFALLRLFSTQGSSPAMLLPSGNSSTEAPQSPAHVDAPDFEAGATPRGLLKSVAAMETTLVLAQPPTKNVEEVEYTLEEYETLKEQKKQKTRGATPAKASGKDTPKVANTPASGPSTRRRSSRTPKAATRYS